MRWQRRLLPFWLFVFGATGESSSRRYMGNCGGVLLRTSDGALWRRKHPTAPRAAMCNMQANSVLTEMSKCCRKIHCRSRWSGGLFFSPPPPPPAGMYISHHDTRSDSHKSFSLRDYFPWRLTPGWFSSLMLARVRPLSLAGSRWRAETLRVWRDVKTVKCEADELDTRLRCRACFKHTAVQCIRVVVC